MPEITFTGIPSGDCECFCWEVTEEEYRRICGDRFWEIEKRDRAESYHEHRTKELGCDPSPWTIYPNDLLTNLGAETCCNEDEEPVVYRVTLKVEETK